MAIPAGLEPATLCLEGGVEAYDFNGRSDISPIVRPLVHQTTNSVVRIRREEREPSRLDQAPKPAPPPHPGPDRCFPIEIWHPRAAVRGPRLEAQLEMSPAEKGKIRERYLAARARLGVSRNSPHPCTATEAADCYSATVGPRSRRRRGHRLCYECVSVGLLAADMSWCRLPGNAHSWVMFLAGAENLV